MKPIILVTGTSSGIGAALVTAAQNDYTVLGTSRHPRPRSEIGFAEYQLDLSRPEEIETFAKELSKELQGASLHAIIHNAGVAIPGTVRSTSVDVFAYQMQVNVLGVYQLTQLLLPHVARSKGRILNIGSISARFTAPFQGMYSASKSSLSCLTKAWRIELAPLGIQVSQLDFGNVQTGIISRALDAMDEAMRHLPYFAPLLPDVKRNALKRESQAMLPAQAVDHILDILARPSLKARYLLGKDARQIALLSKLPYPWFEALIQRKMGIRNKVSSVSTSLFPQRTQS